MWYEVVVIVMEEEEEEEEETKFMKIDDKALALYIFQLTVSTGHWCESKCVVLHQDKRRGREEEGEGGGEEEDDKGGGRSEKLNN